MSPLSVSLLRRAENTTSWSPLGVWTIEGARLLLARPDPENQNHKRTAAKRTARAAAAITCRDAIGEAIARDEGKYRTNCVCVCVCVYMRVCVSAIDVICFFLLNFELFYFCVFICTRAVAQLQFKLCSS